ncbi:MAG TPA: 30S ribosomal protein S8 [Thermoplasmata archaeon]|nr:30S ribosomal protein S8 [Thermoplasmata archaeon]
MQHDPLSDAMSALKNAERTGRSSCHIRPASKLTLNVLKVMKEHGYIGDIELVRTRGGEEIAVRLNGMINTCGVIKPRYAVKRRDLERFEARYLPAQDFGLVILTTTKGVMSHREAKERGIGGRLLAYVY